MKRDIRYGSYIWNELEAIRRIQHTSVGSAEADIAATGAFDSLDDSFSDFRSCWVFPTAAEDAAVVLLSIIATWFWACISNLVNSSFWCFRAPLALEKKMTLLWRSSIMTFLRRRDSRAALRFCSSRVSLAFLLAADDAVLVEYVLRRTGSWCFFSIVSTFDVFATFRGGSSVAVGLECSSFGRFPAWSCDAVDSPSCGSLGFIATGAILNLFFVLKSSARVITLDEYLWEPKCGEVRSCGLLRLNVLLLF